MESDFSMHKRTSKKSGNLVHSLPCADCHYECLRLYASFNQVHIFSHSVTSQAGCLYHLAACQTVSLNRRRACNAVMSILAKIQNAT